MAIPLRYSVAALLVILLATSAAVQAPRASAAVSCPNPNPVVNENNCKGPGTTAWGIPNYTDDIGGFTTQPSFNLGQSVPLKIGRNAPTFPATTVDIAVYRMGYYGGAGGAPDRARRQRPVNNNYTCNTMDPTTGELDCANWSHLHDPGRRAAGVGRLPRQAHRDRHGHAEPGRLLGPRRQPRAPRSVLYVLPTPTYQAYNTWGGKSLYFDNVGGRTPSPATGRAVKVSFNRPLDAGRRRRRTGFFGPDFDTGLVARAAGLRRLLHRRRPVAARTPAAAQAQGARHLRGTPSTGRARSSTTSRPRATPASTSPRSAPTPPTGRSATRTATARSSATRRSRAAARAVSGAISANDPGPGRHRRAPPTTRSAPTGRRAPPTTTRRTRPRRSATTARRRATRTRRPAAASGPNSPRTSSSGSCTSATTTPRLPAHGPGRERQRRVRRRPHLAQHRASRRTPTTNDRRPSSSAGSGTRSRPRPSTSRAARRRQARQLAPTSRSPPTTAGCRTRAATARPPRRRASRARSARSSTRAPSGALVFAAGTMTVVGRALGRRRPARSSRRPTTSSRTWACSPSTPTGITVDRRAPTSAAVASFTRLAEPRPQPARR